MNVNYNGVALKVGRRVPGLLPSTWWDGESRGGGMRINRTKPEQLRAFVDYIHPSTRFVTIRFEMPGGMFREAFPIYRGAMGK